MLCQLQRAWSHSAENQIRYYQIQSEQSSGFHVIMKFELRIQYRYSLPLLHQVFATMKMLSQARQPTKIWMMRYLILYHIYKQQIYKILTLLLLLLSFISIARFLHLQRALKPDVCAMIVTAILSLFPQSVIIKISCYYFEFEY